MTSTTRLLAVLAWREAITAVRTPALWVAMAGHVAVLTAYLLLWGDGVPLAGARPVLEQFATARAALLVVVLPWAAARCGATLRRNDVTRLAALAGCRPSSVVAATVAGLTPVLLLISVSGLPFAFLAAQISAVPTTDLWPLEVPFVTLCLFVAAVETTCALTLTSTLTAWLSATAISMAVVAVAPAGAAGALVLLACGVAGVALLMLVADARFTYLSEAR